MPKPPSRSTPEARWPALIAVVGLGGSSLALPDPLVLGPRWLFPVVVGALLVTTLAAHRAKHHEFDTVLGYAISVIVTLALVTSLVLLLTSLASKSGPPSVLLRSGAVLWVTNILVFALSYW